MSKLADPLRVVNVQREVHRRLRKGGYSAEYREGIPTAYSTASGIVLPALKPPITQDDLDLAWYSVIHEIGHLLRKRMFDILKREKPTELLGYVTNITEDAILEQIAAARAYGDARDIVRGRHGVFIPRMIAKFTETMAANPGKTLDENNVKCAAAFWVCELARRPFIPDVYRKVEAWVREYKLPHMEALFIELVEEGWHKVFHAGLDEEESWAKSVEFFKRLFPEEPTSRDNPEDGEDGKSGDPSDGEGEEGEAGEAAPGTYRISWEDLGKMPDHDGENKGGEVKISYDGWSPASDVSFYPESQIMIRDLEESRCSLPEDYTNTLGNQIRKYVQAMLRKSVTKDRLTGKLNKRALKRVAMGYSDKNRRVFMQPKQREAVDAAFTVLVDDSGSMRHSERDYHAALASAMLVDCLSRGLRLPVEVLSHTEIGTLEIGIAKRFNEHVSGETVFSRLRGERQSGNADGDALMVAARRLARMKNKRKIILFLSDGQPADCWGNSDPGSVLHHAIKMVKSMGIEVYGIGIQHEGLAHWFGKDVQNVTNPSDLERCILETAKRFVTPR